MSAFVKRIQQACESTRSLLCVGLDPDPELMPLADVFEFNRAIIDETASVAAAYKPNLAFYEALGIRGLRALEQTIAHIRDVSRDSVIIGDAKRGDIGPSASAYARAMFRVWEFDAVTVNAWGGADSVSPFLEDETKGVFVWCRGSNPGSGDFQDLLVSTEEAAEPLYVRMARSCSEWNKRGNIGLVAGGTVPDQLAEIRQLCPGMPILVPGVGAQGGELASAVRAGVDGAGRMALINSSRGITYASPGADFAEAAGRAARELRDAINTVLEEDGASWPST